MIQVNLFDSEKPAAIDRFLVELNEKPARATASTAASVNIQDELDLKHVGETSSIEPPISAATITRNVASVAATATTATNAASAITTPAAAVASPSAAASSPVTPILHSKDGSRDDKNRKDSKHMKDNKVTSDQTGTATKLVKVPSWLDVLQAIEKFLKDPFLKLGPGINKYSSGRFTIRPSGNGGSEVKAQKEILKSIADALGLLKFDERDTKDGNFILRISKTEKWKNDGPFLASIMDKIIAYKKKLVANSATKPPTPNTGGGNRGGSGIKNK